jgi:hypothetical protein
MSADASGSASSDAKGWASVLAPSVPTVARFVTYPARAGALPRIIAAIMAEASTNWR